MARTLAFAIIAFTLWLTACSTEPHVAQLAQAGNEPAGPPIPEPGSSHRTASGLSKYLFTEVDMVDNSPLTYWDVDGLYIEGDSEATVNWATLGMTVPAGTPARLDVFASQLFGYSDLWVGVLDPDAQRWIWIDGLQSGALLDLTAYGDLLNDQDEIFICLATVFQNTANGVAVELVVDDPAGDDAPPTWDVAEGLTSLTPGPSPFGGASFALEWGTVSDAGSGPAWYLIYSAPAEHGGIDWSRPVARVAATEAGTDFYPPGAYLWNNHIDYDVVVRAMDAAGNVTTNTDTMSGRWDDPESTDWLARGAWQPGDRLVLTWDNPEREFGLTVYSPNSDWGDAVDNETWINTRSFTLGEPSEDSGQQLEQVGLAAGAAFGLYAIEVRLSQNDEQAQTYRLQVLDSAGNLKQDLGEFEMGEGSFGEGHTMGYLAYFP